MLIKIIRDKVFVIYYIIQLRQNLLMLVVFIINNNFNLFLLKILFFFKGIVFGKLEFEDQFVEFVDLNQRNLIVDVFVEVGIFFVVCGIKGVMFIVW